MSDAELISEIGMIVRSRKVFWIDGDYILNGEEIHWELFVKLWNSDVLVGFDEYMEKYEDAVDLYETHARNKFPDIESALRFVFDSFPLAADKMRRRSSGR